MFVNVGLLEFQCSNSIWPNFEYDWLKLSTIELSCWQIAKFDLADELYPNVSSLCKCFKFHSNE